MRRIVLIAIAAAAAGAVAGQAATTSYERYDALGRVSASCQWTSSSAQRVEYSFDAASNRTRYRSFSTLTSIAAGTGIDSGNGQQHLVMQSDGNLVLYNGAFGSPWTPLWASNTSGSGNNNTAYVQADGNFVIYKQDGTPVWSSGTYGSWCAALYVQPDGKAVMYDLDGKPVWSTS